MFTLQDGREHLWQWDLNRYVVVNDPTIPEVHFCNRTTDCSLVVEVKDGLAAIPNILLQDARPIRVYAYCDDCFTLTEQQFTVKARTKPSDYRYEETTVIRIDEILDRAEEAVTLAEQSATAADKTATDLYEYVDTHTLSFTDDDAGNVILEGVETGSDIDNYYTKEETDTAISTAIADIDIPDVTGFAKLEDIPTIPENVSSFNNDAGYLTQHQSLDGKADKVHTHTLSDITDYVAPAIPTKVSELQNDSGYITAVPAEYVTETELEAKGYLTEHQSLADYAKLTDIPDVSNYQTADQVNTLINNALGVIENGSY